MKEAMTITMTPMRTTIRAPTPIDAISNTVSGASVSSELVSVPPSVGLEVDEPEWSVVDEPEWSVVDEPEWSVVDEPEWPVVGGGWSVVGCGWEVEAGATTLVGMGLGPVEDEEYVSLMIIGGVEEGEGEAGEEEEKVEMEVDVGVELSG